MWSSASTVEGGGGACSTVKQLIASVRTEDIQRKWEHLGKVGVHTVGNRKLQNGKCIINSQTHITRLSSLLESKCE